MTEKKSNPEILRCTKCNARLAATEGDQDGFEIPLCPDCYREEVPGVDS